MKTKSLPPRPSSPKSHPTQEAPPHSDEGGAPLPPTVATVIGLPALAAETNPTAPSPPAPPVANPPQQVTRTLPFPEPQAKPLEPLPTAAPATGAPADPIAELLSSSLLVDDGEEGPAYFTAPLGPPAPPAAADPGAPPPAFDPGASPSPTAAPDLRAGEDEPDVPFVPGGLFGSPGGRSKFLVPVLGGLGLLGLLFVGALVTKAVRSKGPEATEPTAAPATTAAPTAAPAESQADAAVVSEGATAAARPCTVTGTPKVIADRILLPSGVEATTTARGVALGFARGPKEAVALIVDPRTLDVVARKEAKARDVLRRVTPLPDDGGVAIAPDTDRAADRLRGRRTASGAAKIDLGAADAHLAWARHGENKLTALWPLANDAPVEALRAVPLDGGRGHAVAFRQGGAVFLGEIDAELGTRGELTATSQPGSQVGSPVLAASSDAVLALWAERASESDDWGLKSRRRLRDGSDEPTKAFTPPPGGLGAPFMSPGVADAGGGRFFVAWTEGPFSNHQVRAVTLDAKGELVGAPLAISAEGVNAGQGQAAFMADGRGLVAYLAGNGEFELVVTPVHCAVD